MGAAVMLAAVAVTGRRLTWAKVRASLPGGVIFGVNVMAFLSALRLTSVADVLIIGALQPPLTLLLAGPMFGERVGRRDVALTLASVAGVAMVVVGTGGTRTGSLTGDLVAVASLLLFTSYFVVSKRARGSVPAIEYMAALRAADQLGRLGRCGRCDQGPPSLAVT